MPFEAPEFQARVARLQAGMAREGLGALLLTTPADVFYISGFLTRFWESPTRPWFLVVPALGDPVAVIPSIGAELMSRTWIQDIRTWASPDLQDDGVSLLTQTLGDRVPEQGRIGVPMGPETHLRMPLRDYARLQEALAHRAFLDSALVQTARMVKSEAEIALIRSACAIADRAFARVPEIAEEGVPLARVFRDFQRLLLEEGADWVPYLAGSAGPGGYGDVISPATETPLALGDVLMLDTGAVRAGYFCDFDRNWSVGSPSPEVARAHETLYAATEAGLDAARPGATAADVFHAMAAVVGETEAGRLGHGLGLSLTEPPSLISADNTELAHGMVLTLEPELQIAQGRMMVHEEVIVLRDAGPELLSTRAPSSLPRI